MRKTDKKIDNALRKGLTVICDKALEDIEGFKWLTHVVDYNRFPSSLKIILVFDTQVQKHTFTTLQQQQIQDSVSALLRSLQINLRSVAEHILIDCEEDCANQHAGNWQKRLKNSS